MTAAATFGDWMTRGPLAGYVRQTCLVDGLCFACENSQPAGDMSDPAVPELVLLQSLTHGLRARADYGSGRFLSNMPRGAFALIPPNAGSVVSVFNDHAIRAFAFPAARLAPLLAGTRVTPEALDFGHLHSRSFECVEIRRFADRLWSVASDQTRSAQLLVEGLTLAIVAELARLADLVLPASRGGLAPHVLRRVRERMLADLSEDLNLAELARLADLSPFHFLRAFKQSTGLPPQAWRQRARLEAAQNLLANTALPVTDIALQVGYESSQALARAFRDRIGASPTAYRRAACS
jgi:AraC family transcriptional regulator